LMTHNIIALLKQYHKIGYNQLQNNYDLLRSVTNFGFLQDQFLPMT